MEPMRKKVRNEAISVPKFLTRAFGVTTVPESTVSVGATSAVTPTLVTFTLTVPDMESLLLTRSPVRAVVQRVVDVPRCVAVQVLNDTSTESPDARLLTVWVLV